MPPSRIAALGLALMGLGCQAPHKRVYVDFDAVLAGYRSVPLPAGKLPTPPAGEPAATLSLPRVEGRTIVVQGGTESKANAALELNRQEAVRQLTRILAKRYTREVDLEGAELIRGLEPLKLKAMEAARERILTAFRAYAEKRGVRLAQLTSIVGFPDPNPESLPPSQSIPAFARKRLQDAAELRKEISQLDAEYSHDLNDILASVGREYDVNLTDVRLDIEKRRIAGLDRAEREAMAEAASTYKSLVPLLMGNTEMRLSGQPAESVRLPPVPAPARAPAVHQQTHSMDQRRAILKSQLNMWASLNRYEISESPRGASDLTTQFVAWRRERKL
jgi:hypothetical protein